MLNKRTTFHHELCSSIKNYFYPRVYRYKATINLILQQRYILPRKFLSFQTKVRAKVIVRTTILQFIGEG